MKMKNKDANEARSNAARPLGVVLILLAFGTSGCIFGDVKRLQTEVDELGTQVNSLQVTTNTRLGESQKSFQQRQAAVAEQQRALAAKIDSLQGELARTSYELNNLKMRLSSFGQSVEISSRSMRDSLAMNLDLLEVGMMERLTRRDSVYNRRLMDDEKEIAQLP